MIPGEPRRGLGKSAGPIPVCVARRPPHDRHEDLSTILSTSTNHVFLIVVDTGAALVGMALYLMLPQSLLDWSLAAGSIGVAIGFGLLVRPVSLLTLAGSDSPRSRRWTWPWRFASQHWFASAAIQCHLKNPAMAMPGSSPAGPCSAIDGALGWATLRIYRRAPLPGSALVCKLWTIRGITPADRHSQT